MIQTKFNSNPLYCMNCQLYSQMFYQMTPSCEGVYPFKIKSTLLQRNLSISVKCEESKIRESHEWLSGYCDFYQAWGPLSQSRSLGRDFPNNFLLVFNGENILEFRNFVWQLVCPMPSIDYPGTRVFKWLF